MPRLQVPGTPLPHTALLLGVMRLVLVFSGRKAERPTPWWFAVTLGGVLAALVCSMLVNRLFTFDSIKRVAHVVLIAALAMGLASGFIPFRNAIRGLIGGMIPAVILGFFAIAGPNLEYRGRLTGPLLGEPNFAGLLLAVAGPVAALEITNRKARNTFIVLGSFALFLTLSRTSYLAFALALVWIGFGRRVKPLLGLSLLTGLVVIVTLVPAEVHTAGFFSTRVGSDVLRTRILEKEIISIEQAPVLGHGPGTATVELPGQAPFRFYFHSSYYALVQEGGLVAMAMFIALLLTLFFKLAALPPRHRNPLLEGSVIALAVCGITLGEVLLELIAAIALGAAVRHVTLHADPRLRWNPWHGLRERHPPSPELDALSEPGASLEGFRA
jgi:hypothetical protein